MAVTLFILFLTDSQIERGVWTGYCGPAIMVVESNEVCRKGEAKFLKKAGMTRRRQVEGCRYVHHR